MTFYRHFREDDLKGFRRALRRRDQERFDRLMDDGLEFAMAAKAWNPRQLREAVWLSLFMVQQREIDRLRERVEELDEL